MKITEIDATGIVINEFNVIPSEKNKTGRSRIHVSSDGGQNLMAFKLYDDNTIEILSMDNKNMS